MCFVKNMYAKEKSSCVIKVTVLNSSLVLLKSDVHALCC